MKFYHFSQNNSGGVWDRDENVDTDVIIEANSATEANEIAERIGIYFNGCAEDEDGNSIGRDCPCCGDRWHPMWDDDEGDEVPSIYGKELAKDANGNYITNTDSRGFSDGKAIIHYYTK